MSTFKFEKLKVKPGTPRTLDAGDNPTYDEYFNRIDKFLVRFVGVSLHDLPDRPYVREWLDDRIRPIHAANKAISIINRSGSDF